MKLILSLWTIFLMFTGVFSSSTADDRPIAIIRRAKPDLWIKHGKGEWKAPSVAEQLFSGDSVKTGAEGYAAIQFMDNSLVKIKPNSILAIMGEVRGKDNASTRLAVQVGEVFLNVTKQKSDFEVGTPSAVAAVKGSKAQVGVDQQQTTVVEALEGVWEVTSTVTGVSAKFTRGQKATVQKSSGEIKREKMTASQMQQTSNSYNNLDKKSRPKTMKLRFSNKDGSVQEVEVEYFEANSTGN
jgi:hypothetical protein